MLQSQTLQQSSAAMLTTEIGFYSTNTDALPAMPQMQPDPLVVQQALMSDLLVQSSIIQVRNDMQDLAIADINDIDRPRKASPPLHNLSVVGVDGNGGIISSGQGSFSALDAASPSLMNMPIGARSSLSSSDNLNSNFDGNIADLALRSELSTLAAERDSFYRKQHMADLRMNEIQME